VAIDPRALDILIRRPRLVVVLLAVYEMLENNRNCRVSVDVRDGVVRVFREVQVHSVVVVREEAVLPPPA